MGNTNAKEALKIQLVCCTNTKIPMLKKYDQKNRLLSIRETTTSEKPAPIIITKYRTVIEDLERSSYSIGAING